MRAILPSDDGRAEIVSQPRPHLGSSDVLVRTSYAGINRADILQIKNLYPLSADDSPIPGLEISGEIVALGADVTHLCVGQSIAALLSGGGYAEYVSVPAEHVILLEKNQSLSQAATLMEGVCTSYYNLVTLGQLVEGDKVLIHAGASGIGAYAIWLAKRLGAEVFTTTRDGRKKEALVQLGADQVIEVKDSEFVAAFADVKMDIVLDMVGGNYLVQNLELLAENGRLLQVGFLASPKAEITLLPILAKSLTVTGTMIRKLSFEKKTQLIAEIKDKIWPLVLEYQNTLPAVAKVFAFEEVNVAHEYVLKDKDRVGHVVLEL